MLLKLFLMRKIRSVTNKTLILILTSRHNSANKQYSLSLLNQIFKETSFWSNVLDHEPKALNVFELVLKSFSSSGGFDSDRNSSHSLPGSLNSLIKCSFDVTSLVSRSADYFGSN
jgi:hypothetical protein